MIIVSQIHIIYFNFLLDHQKNYFYLDIIYRQHLSLDQEIESVFN